MPFSSYDKCKRNTRQKKKKLYYALLDLEKAFDKSPKRGGEMGFAEAGCE